MPDPSNFHGLRPCLRLAMRRDARPTTTTDAMPDPDEAAAVVTTLRLAHAMPYVERNAR